MFDVKLARDDSVVIVVSSLMALTSSKRESQSCDHVFVVSLCGMDVIVYTRKVLRRHLHKSTWFYVIIERMRKQWTPRALFPLLRAWVRNGCYYNGEGIIPPGDRAVTVSLGGWCNPGKAHKMVTGSSQSGGVCG